MNTPLRAQGTVADICMNECTYIKSFIAKDKDGDKDQVDYSSKTMKNFAYSNERTELNPNT